MRPYLPRLDGLRGVSILLVLLEHYLIPDYELGGLGVITFFVLSGYLITNILLTYSATLTPRQSAAMFYWRRFIRLFPVFYLCIAITAIFNIGGMRDLWLINVLYVMNYKIAHDGAFLTMASPYWSLDVEEHFYLIWFLVITFAPTRYLTSIIGFCIVSALAFRTGVFCLGYPRPVMCILPGPMDSLAIGAALACGGAGHLPARLWTGFLKWRWPATGVLGVCVCLIPFLHIAAFTAVLFNFLASLFAACVVSLAIEDTVDRRLDWLRNTKLRQLGKISYAVYVVHMFMYALDNKWPHTLGQSLPLQILRVFVYSGMSIGLAMLSWRFIEEPLLRYKNRISFMPKENTRISSTM